METPRSCGRAARPARSEERRVGKECSSPCRSRWSPDYLKKKILTADGIAGLRALVAEKPNGSRKMTRQKAFSYRTTKAVIGRWSVLFFFKQKTAYEMVMSDWSSDVCSSDLRVRRRRGARRRVPLHELPPRDRARLRGARSARRGEAQGEAPRELARAAGGAAPG